MAQRAPKPANKQSEKRPPYQGQDRDEPVTLYPLEFEQAVKALLKVDSQKGSDKQE